MPEAVGVVVDPIQSVKGKVVIDCFRLKCVHIRVPQGIILNRDLPHIFYNEIA